GYHYAPLDYAFGGCGTASNITFNAGTAVGWFRTGSGYYWGGMQPGQAIRLDDWVTASFNGTATSPDYFVRCNVAQESPFNGYDGGVGPGGLTSSTNQFIGNSSRSAIVNLQFTRCSVMAGEAGSYFADDWGYMTVRAKDCEFLGGAEVGFVLTCCLTNCLFDRVWDSGQIEGSPGNEFFVQNCTYHGGQLRFSRYNPWYGMSLNIPVCVRDSSFDCTTLSTADALSSNTNLTDYANNAFILGQDRVVPTNINDVVVSSFDWQSSWFGNYYLPSDSPLIDRGSTTADQVGLYEFTTQTNQVKEGTNIVDLGYHYVATDAYGNPLDTYVSGTPDYLVDTAGNGMDTNGLPYWWEGEYFGQVGLDPNSDPDGDGNTLLYDYQNTIDPNVIAFTASVTNNYVNIQFVPVQLSVTAGEPFYYAMLVNDTNLADANWQPYTGTNLIVTLGSADGAYNASIGLKGLPASATQTWQTLQLNLDTVAPLIVITNPAMAGGAATTVTRPMIQLQGYSSKSLGSLTFDVSNAVGVVSGQQGFVISKYYDTNLYKFTTNWFQCFDIPLTNGLNVITLHAADYAGNATTTNLNFALDYSTATNPPMFNLLWPQNGDTVSGNQFTLTGQMDDWTATITASLADTNGVMNSFNGLVERSGKVWIENLPLNPGTNILTVTATDAAGNVASTNITVINVPLALTINEVPDDQLNGTTVSEVDGTINLSGYTVWVNGVKATNYDGGTWSAFDVPLGTSQTAVIQARAIPNSDNGGNGGGQ
ncbi:MAG TPA: hypothetical protein VMB22_06845, partial [Verrucomicrobiae bacterium]|nr:hypothetical protein [Verrucomicrobiae bacterium]